jgi:hypothetical protein
MEKDYNFHGITCTSGMFNNLDRTPDFIQSPSLSAAQFIYFLLPSPAQGELVDEKSDFEFQKL